MRNKILILFCMFIISLKTDAQFFDLTKQQPRYTDIGGYGYDITATPTGRSKTPFYFSVKVPDGNYLITVTLGSRNMAGSTVVRAENRRLLIEETSTRRGELKTFQVVVNKRSVFGKSGKRLVNIKERERDYFHWDNKLTFEFNGKAPCVHSIRIEPDTAAITVYLCGNSTVVDQFKEPWASWGQMFPRWFDKQVAVCNLAESGLTAGTFLAQGRLDYIMEHIKPGDYVFCEFGHNDQKEKSAGSGAWYNFSYNLKKYVDRVRQARGNIVFCTPTQRRYFDESHLHIVETHGDYPEAMRTVARREHVPIIELHDMTRTFFEALGYENSTKALVFYPANSFPGQTVALADNTHFNPYGAYEVSKMVVMGLKAIKSPLVQHLRSDWTDYNPAHPDDFRQWHWAPSLIFETAKPDGN